MNLFDFCHVHPLLLWFLPFILGLGVGYLLWARYKEQIGHLAKTNISLTQNVQMVSQELDTLKNSYTLSKSELSKAYQTMRQMETANSAISVDKMNAPKTKDVFTSEFNKKVIDNKFNVEKNEFPNIVANSADQDMKSDAISTLIPTESVPNISSHDIIDHTKLQILEGIGPKIESILHSNNIHTFEDVASKSASDMRSILDSFGTKYRMIDPKPWIDQARLGSIGDYDGLVLKQKELYASKNPNSNHDIETKVEKYLYRIGFLRRYAQDDLKAVEGIGPKIEMILHSDGIKTWANLADQSVDRLKLIIEKAGPKFMLADPTTWPEQALLAHRGHWTELDDLQKALKGGRLK